MERKIGIVGGGVSGLLACKYALSKGYNPTVFESRSYVGGIWGNTLDTTRLQTSKSLYQFSDYPWPSSVDHTFPKGDQVLEYVQSYAKHFDLLRHVRLNTKVLSMDFEGASEWEIEDWSLWGGTGEAFGKGEWVLHIEDLATQSQQVMRFDFVILCVGRYSDLPNMPDFPKGEGPDIFQGKVMHYKDYSSMDNDDARNMIKGKQVAVVGSQKSALEIALESSQVNGSGALLMKEKLCTCRFLEHNMESRVSSKSGKPQNYALIVLPSKELPCHLIVRSPRWNLLDYNAWGFPIPLLFQNRFSELLFHKPGEGIVHSLLATAFTPLMWLICKFVESDIKQRQPLKRFGLVPDFNFIESLYSCTFAIFPPGFYDHVEKGSIILNRAQKFNFTKSGIVIDGERKTLDLDLVIFATGFKGDQKLGSVFSSPTFQKNMMGSQDSIVPLYRQCIHPRIPQLAVLGYSESVSNLYTFEMRCRWLMELLDGAFKVPTVKMMEKDILEWDKFMKRYGGKHYRRSCIGPIHIWYNDQLCKDMGWNPRRKKGLFSELFGLYGPLDYANTS